MQNFNQQQVVAPANPIINNVQKTRQHKLGLVTGIKGSGKSYTTFGTLLDIYRGNISMSIPPRKVLIMDVNNEYELMPYKGVEYKVPALDIKNLSWFSEHKIPRIMRIAPFSKNSKMGMVEIQEALYKVIHDFANGVLLIEDINKYIGSSFSQELIGTICSHRHSNLDIIMHYQSIGKINPTLWQNFNWMRMHIDSDNAKRIYEKTSDFNHLLQIGQCIVKERWSNGEKRYYIYYNHDDRIISGDITKDEATNAILKTISYNKSDMLNPLTMLMDKNGKKVYTTQQAIEKLLNEYLTTNFKFKKVK